MRFLVYVAVVILCATAARAQNSPLPVPTPIVDPFDNYGPIPWESEMGHLDNFAVLIENNPRMIGYIMVFGDKNGCPLNAQRRAVRAKRYMVERRGINPNRIIWRDLGYLNEQLVYLEGQIPGAEYPFDHPTPVPASQVKLKRCSAPSNLRSRRSRKSRRA